MKRDATAFALLTLAFLALFALTAQRGLGWGDSGEFQHRILDLADGMTKGCDSLATAHPLYVLLGKCVASSPFAVNLISAFFGALAVGGFFLCTRNLALSAVFGLSHALWWLSCVAEVYTMSLAFTAFETFFLLRLARKGGAADAAALMLLNGLHLSVHNFALLPLPVYIVVAFSRRRAVVAAVAWLAGAAFHLSLAAKAGLSGALFGSYGGTVFSLWPSNWTLTAFNYALAALSFAAPAFLLKWRIRDGGGFGGVSRAVLALFAIHAVFWARYFVKDQFTFALPTLFFAYMLLANVKVRPTRAVALAAMQVVLPLAAWQVAAQFEQPGWRMEHKYRDDAAYFCLPWKFLDRSADRCAAETPGEWTGYPYARKESAK